MNAGAKVLGKHIARGFQSNLLQPVIGTYPFVKRHTQTSSVISLLSPPLSRRLSLSATTPSHPNSTAVTAAAALATTAAVVTASASSLSADDMPIVGRFGYGKPKDFGQRGSHTPQPNAMSVQTQSIGVVGQAGEDAFFTSDNGRAWGVADGVGGWASVAGADSAAYSRTLMHYALHYADRVTGPADTSDAKQPAPASSAFSKLFASTPPSAPSPASSSSASSAPLRILDAAYAATATHNIVGSTTACIVTYDPAQRQLHYANLGDSGFLLVRHGQTAAIRSVEKQHSFNCPYQLGSQSGDRPSDAAVAAVDVFDNDILVLATDGFFDNLHASEIVHTCRQHSTAQPSVDANALAKQLCDEAYAAASDGKRDTPFSQYCRRYGKRHSGGKMDDISVLIVQFKVRAEQSEAAADGTASSKPKSKL